MSIYSCSVQPLQVEISINTDQFISESIVILSCTINLSPRVNSGERIVTTWHGLSGHQLINSSGLTVSNIHAFANGVFQSNVTISSYVPAVNNGEYTCNATVIPSSSYVMGNSGTDRRRVMITGWFIISSCILVVYINVFTQHTVSLYKFSPQV